MTQFVGEEGSGFGKAYLMRCPVDLDLGMLDFYFFYFWYGIAECVDPLSVPEAGVP